MLWVLFRSPRQGASNEYIFSWRNKKSMWLFHLKVCDYFILFRTFLYGQSAQVMLLPGCETAPSGLNICNPEKAKRNFVIVGIEIY